LREASSWFFLLVFFGGRSRPDTKAFSALHGEKKCFRFLQEKLYRALCVMSIIRKKVLARLAGFVDM
jgi:hypothetical protein